MKIIISLTSNVKHIGNVKTVIESLLKQTIKPDFIELNLSLKDFPNMENDLPIDLNELFDNNSCVEVNWVSGDNTNLLNIIPTVKKFFSSEEYYLLTVNDVWFYRKDYVKTMINFLEKYRSDVFCLSNLKVNSSRTIYFSSCFSEDFWEKLTDEFSNFIDDIYIEKYLQYHWKIMASYGQDMKNIIKEINKKNRNLIFENDKIINDNDVKKTNEILDRLFGGNKKNKIVKPHKIIVKPSRF